MLTQEGNSLNAEQKNNLRQLIEDMKNEFDGETFTEPDPLQANSIACAVQLMQSRQSSEQMLDEVICLMNLQENDFARHTLKNLARFLNLINKQELHA